MLSCVLQSNGMICELSLLPSLKAHIEGEFEQIDDNRRALGMLNDTPRTINMKAGAEGEKGRQL